jgi:pimeloyl-ACP methyl ester carboxylesterase
MSPTKGILYVTMHPKSADVSIEEFHDWYQNEHGPARLRLSSFINGFRYKATDDTAPGFMAIYDMVDMNALIEPGYTKLRGPPFQTQRERDVMAKLTVDRRFYDLGAEFPVDGFEKLEDVKLAGEATNVMVTASVTLKDEALKEKYEKWFDEEHVKLLSKVPGWRRSRRFFTSSIETGRGFEILGIHEYSVQNGLGGPEYNAALNTPWRTEIFEQVVQEKRRKQWELFYVFGSASRDLTHPSHSIELGDGKTKVIHDAKTGNAIESCVTTKDGAVLKYRLENSADPKAPVVVMINPVLTDLSVWDSFVRSFRNEVGDKYRFLRFDSRGRYDTVGDEEVTLDLLTDDVICLLNALQIYKADLVLGVSLGGASALNLALHHPDRIGAFVSCDTNSKAPEGNPAAWNGRVDIAEKQAAKDGSGSAVVGDELADMTTKRWFTEVSQTNDMRDEFERIKTMVSMNSLHGFKKGVKALYAYDLTSMMKSGKSKGLFLAGSADGALPKSMKTMATYYGNGASELVIVDGAGHLPMVEKPEAFTQAVVKFLKS